MTWHEERVQALMRTAREHERVRGWAFTSRDRDRLNVAPTEPSCGIVCSCGRRCTGEVLQVVEDDYARHVATALLRNLERVRTDTLRAALVEIVAAADQYHPSGAAYVLAKIAADALAATEEPT